MSGMVAEGLGKPLLRQAYGAALGLHALASAATSGAKGPPRVFYGGARSGDVGGPLVKVKRLREFFPERRWDYNLVYCLSNAPYLPDMALALLKRRGVPIVHNQNGVFYAGWYDGDWRAQNARMARSYHAADHVFWQSEFCRRCADEFLGPRAGTGEILFNAIDTARFRPAARPAGDRFTFLLTGKIDLHLYYRLESTIAGLAAARSKGLDAGLVIAGWVAEDAEIRAKAQAAALGIANQVLFSGAFTQETAPSIYGAADAYVMTKHNDPCPNTVLEAMACGLPVLYSSSGGVPELVGADAGIGLAVRESWVAPEVPEAGAVADGMLAVAAERDRMAQAARTRAVAHFDINHWIGRHRAVFDQVLA